MKTASENASPPASFYFVGEHTALDFANTLLAANGTPVEMLTSYAGLFRWLEEARLTGQKDQPELPAALPTVKAEGLLLDQLRALRALWKAALARLISGRDLSPELLTVLNLYLREDLSWPLLARRSKGKGYELRRSHVPIDPGRKILALLSTQLADFIAQADLKYLRKCAGPGCVIYFYDTTKNHRRQWCSMAVCGNRHKVAAFRQRQGLGHR